MSDENILVVDDEVRINAFIRELVAAAGYRAEAALSGEEALAILSGGTPQSEQAFDLVLLDIMLPGIDGYEVCRRIKADPAMAGISIIMLTAMGKVANKTRGLELGADDYIPKPFDNNELLARIKAVLRVREAEKQIRRRNRDLAALNTIAETVGRAIELPDVLNTALDQALGTLELDAGTLTLTNLAGAQTVVVNRWEALDLTAGMEAANQVASSGQPLLLSLDAAHQNAACVPLHSRNHVVGTLLVAGKREVDAATLDLLAAIGHQVGAAIERARLYEIAQTRSEDLAVLNDITRAITSSLDLEDVLTVSMRGIREFLHVEASSLILVDEKTGQLVFGKTLGRDQEWKIDSTLQPGEGIVGAVIQQREPILVHNAQAHPLFSPKMDRITGFVTRSALCVPIVVKGKAIGAIETINKIGIPFTNDDLEMLSFLAASVGVALENARLYGELAQSKQELERSQTQLIHAEKLAATGRLAASIAHEINNPLQAIQNCLHLVLNRPLTDEKKSRYLNMAQEEVERLITIVTRTLDFYRPSKGRPSPTQVNDVVEAVLALAGKRLEHGHVRVQRKLTPDLPQLTVVRDQLTQVFLNLVINAAEAMSEGGELTISSACEDNWVCVGFSDTGPGIPPDEVSKIFEPFYTTKATGTGLGLAVSYGIVERQGGRIMVDSQRGQGATLTVRLPIGTQ
jgi:signal transduction histidine kinase/DNA-binding response OmpR family regulator